MRLHSWRTAALSVVTSLALVILALPAISSAEDQNSVLIRSGELDARVSTTFPQVLGWTYAGKPVTANPARLTSLLINGTEQPVTVTSFEAAGARAIYQLRLDQLSGAELTAELVVAANTLTFRITKITEPAGVSVRTLQIPGHDLVSITSSDPQGVVASSRTSVDRGRSSDTFTAVGQDTKPGPDEGSTYVLASTGEVAAAFESNSMYESGDPRSKMDSNRFQRRTVAENGTIRVGISSGQWLYRAEGSQQTEELPWFRVALANDLNNDDEVTWQDAAIAMRSIAVMPKGGEQVKQKAVQRIPFNFASQATHPFLRTLDDTKRIALATDGLGQHALLKGFGSEGHDSANTDFADNYNTRAGGLSDLNRLLSESRAWNTSYGIHINQTEAYPESRFFDQALIDPAAKGWNWLDQSYYINQPADVLSGNLAKRIKRFREQTDTNLDMVYVDVFYRHGWLAQRLQDELVGNGFRVASEWSDKLARNNTWSHWAVDEEYGGSTNKGINSEIQRFIFNDVRDTWNPHPLLGSTRAVEFEGWTGQNDYRAFLANVWQQNVPTKFLQHHQIRSWQADRIGFSDGVVARGTSLEDRVIEVNGAVVARGGVYLLPWQSATGEAQKAYHYNPSGGTTTWKLTGSLARSSKLTLYPLTDTGRGKGVRVTPDADQTITITAQPGQPYVLVSEGASKLPAPQYGNGSPVADPGFNGARITDSWRTSGAVSVVTTDLGHRVAKLGSGRAASISQRLGRLDRGTYSVSAWVEIQPGQQRSTTLSVKGPGVKSASTTIARSTALNQIGADEKHGTYFQRVRVLVDVTRTAGRPELTIRAAAGSAAVLLDDVRVVRTGQVSTADPNTIVSEDFEQVDQGWGPLVKSTAGGANDPRTHLSERNEPYTQAGWNQNVIDDVIGGNWSLKSNGERRNKDGSAGLVYRTTEATAAFTPGHRYRVSFDHQSNLADQYAWVNGYDTAEGPAVSGQQAIGEQRRTGRLDYEFTAGKCGANFTGLLRTGSNGSALFVLDNLKIVDLGPTSEQPTCGRLTFGAERYALYPGEANEVTTRFTSNEPDPITDLRVALAVPDGWTATATTPATAQTLMPGESLITTWAVTPPKGDSGVVNLSATADYRTATGDGRATGSVPGEVIAAFGSGDTWASDHPWVSASGGWGPVERDQSNGGQGSGDGTPLTLNGKVYPKGLGTHAPSTVRYFTGGTCTTFAADVGVDDSQTRRSSIVFRVLADGTEVAATDVLRPDSATVKVRADISGARFVDLVVTDAGDGNGNDHADWADAKFSCS